MNGPVMWAEPFPNGEGARSAGTEEPVRARGVTGGVAAQQTRTAGATHAVAGHAGQAMPASHNAASTKSCVTETGNAGEVDAWTKWRMNAAARVYLPGLSGGILVDEAAKLGREKAFAIVKAARAMLHDESEARRSRQDTPASHQTIADYDKKCRQVDTEIGEIEPGGSSPLVRVMSRYAPKKQTFSVMKTALKWRGLERLRTLLRTQDMLQREHPDSVSWRAAVLALNDAVRELVAVQSLQRQGCMELAGTTSRPSRSKKRILPHLPPGWQERFLDANLSSAKYRMAGVLLRHCGMRPKELALGVTLTASSQGVQVKIDGAKVRETAGQPWRMFTLKTECLPEWFIREVKSKEKTVVRVDEDALRTHLNRLSDRVFYPDGRRAPHSSKSRMILSAYVFRHALVTDLREDGWETEDIAAVIGESSAETVRHYGIRVRTRSKSPKRVAIDVASVQVARTVRAVDRSGLNDVLRQKAKVRCKRPRISS